VPADAEGLLAQLTRQAARLVRENRPLIARVAFRLAEAGGLSGAAIDAILLDAQS
jgi:hypothetical protein